MTYYDRNGTPISAEGWAHTLERDRRVASTRIPESTTWVSTVWLGIDHSFGFGPPLIFETMVFADPDKSHVEDDGERYSTEAEALAGHLAMVRKLVGPSIASIPDGLIPINDPAP